MKAIGYLLILLTMYSCTGLPQKPDLGSIWGRSEEQPLTQETIILTENDPSGILSEVSRTLREGKSKEYSGSYNGNTFEGYAGDYLFIPLKSEDNFKLVSYPRNISYELGIKGNNLVFRSIYQGEFTLDFYSLGEVTRRVKISNKLKYRFTEQNNYDIILKNYASNDIKQLQNSVALHRMAYPDSFRDKEISFMLMELAGKDGNIGIVKEEIEFLKKYKTLDEQDKLTILDTLTAIGATSSNLDPVLLEYDSANTILNKELKRIILAKSSPKKDEIEFLEKDFRDEPTKEAADFIGNWYLRNGDINKGTQYINGTIEGIAPELLESIFTKNEEGTVDPMAELENKNYTQFRSFLNDGESSFNKGSYVEALVHFEKALEINKNYAETKDIYFYMGQSNLQLDNGQKAIENYKKALDLEKSDDKKAEIYYNMGIAYDKLGNKEESRNYFTFVRQKFPKSSWSTKSSIYLLKLN